MRPSHSIRGLRKGSLEKPRSFRDRVYMTDVGEAAWRAARSADPSATFALRSHRDYIMTKAKIRAAGLEADLEGHKLGRSSWTVVYRIVVRGDDAQVRSYLSRLMAAIGRGPLDTPYWSGEEWSALQSSHGTTRESGMEQWRRFVPGAAAPPPA